MNIISEIKQRQSVALWTFIVFYYGFVGILSGCAGGTRQVTQIVPVTQVIPVTQVVPVTQFVPMTEVPPTATSILTETVQAVPTLDTQVTPAPTLGPNSVLFTVSADQDWQGSGVGLVKGQQVTISYLSGIWSLNTRGGDLYKVGPDGYTKRYVSSLQGKCWPMPLPNAPYGALVARIGNGPAFLVGSQLTFTANQSDWLSLRINDDCTGDDYGFIDIAIEVAPAEDTQPIPTPTKGSNSSQFTVSAHFDWQDSGIPVTVGDEVTVTYVSGRWTFNLLGGELYYVLADGYDKPYVSTVAGNCRPMPLPEGPYGALLARIDYGPPVLVGSQHTFTAYQSGWLAFRINDDCMNDDSGLITIRIEVVEK
jgi:hypothetical protein